MNANQTKEMTEERWQRAKQLFNSALELEADHRAGFLEEACAGDEALRSEVESLIDSYQRADGFIDAPVIDDALQLFNEARTKSAAGRRIGQYEIIREIGHGGMGSVYLAARADDQYKKQVAIKLVRQGFDTQFIVTRFIAERQILANLDHKNIARLLDGGTTEEGLPYLVMEFIEGLPIDTYCDQNRLGAVERLKLFRIVCSAVAYAHQNLVIHRDIKPSNILVTADGTPKLLDFGIAKLLSSESTDHSTNETGTAIRLMTPDYASPEQVRGQRITTASDVYSLGVLLYRLLTGLHPYQFKTPLPSEVERVICETAPPRPSEAISRVKDAASLRTPDATSRAWYGEPQRLRRMLSGDLDTIILMAMRKEPARRYLSVQQFSEDIERHLTGLPVVARKVTFAYRASKFIGRNKVAVAAAALVLLAIIAGLTVSIWQGRVAASERDQARREKAKSEELNKFLQSILSAASPEERGKDATVIQVLNDAADRIDAEFSDQPELKAQMLLTVGRTYGRLGLVREFELKLREALQVNSALYGEANKATTASMIYLGEALMAGTSGGAKLDEAEGLLTRGVELERKLSPAGSKDLAWGLFGLGEVKVRKGEYETAQPLLQESVAISDRISGDNNEDSATALISLGRAKQFSADIAGAEAVYRQSIAIFRSLPPHYENRLATTLLNLGNLLLQKGSYDEAISTSLEADGIFQKLSPGQANLFTYYGKTYLTRAYMHKGDYEKTAEEARKAIEFGRKVGLVETPDFLSTLDSLGLSLTRMGKAREGEPYLRESLEQGRKILPKADVKVLLTESALGECLTAQNRFVEAEPLIIGSCENLKATQGEKNGNTVLALKRAVELYEKWNKPQLATQYRALLRLLPTAAP